MWNMKVTFIRIIIGVLRTVTEMINKGTGGLGNEWTRGDHPNFFADIGQNTEKSLGDLRRLAVTQRPSANADVKNPRSK